MMRTTLFGLLLLAGCASEGDSNRVGGNQVSTNGAQASAPAPPAQQIPAQQVMNLVPGEWEATVSILRMEGASMPSGGLPIPPPTTTRNCISPDQADKPLDGILNASAMPAGCVSERAEVSGGRINATFSCAQNNVPSRITISGAFSPTNYDMNMEMRAGEGAAAIRSDMRVTGRRIGECPNAPN